MPSSRATDSLRLVGTRQKRLKARRYGQVKAIGYALFVTGGLS